MKVTDVLRQQHRDARRLFERVLSASGDVPRVMDELGNNLLAHMLAERVVLLPEVRALEEGLADEEHGIARFELWRILNEDPSDPGYMAKVSRLRSLFERHVREEEQELLPRVEARLPDEVSERLGGQMKELFDTLVVRSKRGLTT